MGTLSNNKRSLNMIVVECQRVKKTTVRELEMIETFINSGISLITESCLNSSILDSEIYPDVHNCIRKDWPYTHTSRAFIAF